MESKKIFYIILVAFYIIAVCTRLYWMNQKAGLYIDEHWAIALSNYTDYCIDRDFDKNKIYSGQELKQLTLCDDPSVTGALKDIKKLYFDNRDTPHTNLYYSLLRISLIGLETSDFKEITFRGTMLNLFLFTFSYILFFLLANLTFKDKFISLIAVFCTFMSTATISNTIFLRPYQLQETFFIALAYFIVWVLNNVKSQKIVPQTDKFFITFNFKLLLITAIITAFALLTGYYTIVYIGLLGLFIVYYNVKENSFSKDNLKTELKFYGIALVLALLFAQTLYSHYFVGYFSYRATGTIDVLLGYGSMTGFRAGDTVYNVLNNITDSFIVSLQILYQHYFTYYFLTVIALLLLYLMITKNKIEVNVRYIGLPIVAIVFSFVIMYLAHIKTLRYLMPVVPFLIMIPMVLFKAIKNKTHKIIFASLLIFASVLPAHNHQNIQYTYINQPKLKFTNDTSIPVVIITNNNPFDKNALWQYFYYITCLNDKQNYFIVDSINDIKNIELLNMHDEFYILSLKDTRFQDNKQYNKIVNNQFNIIEYDETVLDKIYIHSIASWKIKK